jgi:hypothetical protein
VNKENIESVVLQEYRREKTVKLIDNLGETFFQVPPSQIYKLHLFENAGEFLSWAQKNKSIKKLKTSEIVDIEIDLRCCKTKGLIAS